MNGSGFFISYLIISGVIMFLSFLKRLVATMVLAVLTSSVYAESNVTVGRYLTTTAQPLSEQQDLLLQTFQVKFPRSVKIIEHAVEHLLQFSGYTLVNKRELPSPAQAILIKPLPEVDRTLGAMSLQDGLLTLVGSPFRLLIDPVHRFISFNLRVDYRPIYPST